METFEERVTDLMTDSLEELGFNDIGELVDAFSNGQYDEASLNDYCTDSLDWSEEDADEQAYLDAMDAKRDALAGK